MWTITHYKTEWWDGKQWIASNAFLGNRTLEQARDDLQSDIGYFYSDIPIRLVQVVETVLEMHEGSQQRPR